MANRNDEKRRSRRSYYDDYKKTASGEYVYTGVEYEFTSKDGKSRKVRMRELLVLSIISLIVFFVPGFLLVPGLNYCAYVLLPYAAGVLLSVYLLVITIRLAAAKDSVKAWEYDKAVKPLPVAVKALFCAAVLNIVCESIYLFTNGAGEMVLGAVIFLVCQTIGAVIGYILVRLVKKSQWKLIL